MILGAVGSVLMIIILISFGYFAAYSGWVSKGTSLFITKLIINITLPCTILNSFLTNFTRSELLASGKYILVAFLGVLAFYLIGLAVSRIAKIEKGRRGVFTALFSFSNSVFIGFPVALAIFGEKGMIFAIFYFFANTTCFNTLGYLQIAGDGVTIRKKRLTDPLYLAEASCSVEGPVMDGIPRENAGIVCSPEQTLYETESDVLDVPPRETAASMIKRVLQPPVIAVFTAIVLVLLGVRLPDFANSTLTYAGGITSPLSLIFVGIIVHRVGFKTLRFQKGLPLVMVGRFILAPLVMLGAALAFGIDSFATQVFVVQMALPCMVTVVIYAEACGADSGYATRGMVLSTLLSLIMLPILVILFGG